MVTSKPTMTELASVHPSSTSNVLTLVMAQPQNAVIVRSEETSLRKCMSANAKDENMQEKTKLVLPVKKRKIEGIVKKQRTKNSSVSQKQCKLDFPPCRVCLGRGSGLHYGVNSCESCKSFFRRCLTRKEEYKCSKNYGCPVTSQIRGNCSGCRYKRCLEVGMSRENACLGRYTLSRRTQTIMEAKGENVLSCDSINSPPQASPGTPIAQTRSIESESQSCEVVQFTDTIDLKGTPMLEVEVNDSEVELTWVKEKSQQNNEELMQEIDVIEELKTAMQQIKPFRHVETEEEIKMKIREDYESYMTKAQVFGNMKPVPQDEYHALLESTGIDIDGRQEFLRQSAMSCQPVLHSYIAFANVVPGFSSLSLEDQCSLLKTSHFEVFLLLTYKGYDPELQMILTETGKAYHIDQAADIFYSRQLINSIFDVCKKIQSLHLTSEETAFLLAIAVTFGDRCELECSEKVDEIQLKVVKMFRNLLLRTRPETATKFFTKVVDCFIAMRAVGDQYLKEYGVICQDKLVQKEAPIWLAYINANTVRQQQNSQHTTDVLTPTKSTSQPTSAALAHIAVSSSQPRALTSILSSTASSLQDSSKQLLSPLSASKSLASFASTSTAVSSLLSVSPAVKSIIFSDQINSS